MNEDTGYELLTQRIYQLLLKYDGFDNVEVKHNVRLKGKSGVKHQIDVYWEFKTAGVLHRVAIECKNYTHDITLGRIRDFHSVLNDLGVIYGIMVTKKGFQSGVVDYAAHQGIGLKLLRDPIEDDWDGRLKKITIEMNLVLPKITKRQIIVDEQWVKQNIPEDKWNINYSVEGMVNEVWILDNEGNKFKNFHELEMGVPHKWKAESNLSHTYNFPNHFIETQLVGLLKINELILNYDVFSSKGEKIEIDAQEVVDKVLKDFLTNEVKFIRKDGTVD